MVAGAYVALTAILHPGDMQVDANSTAPLFLITSVTVALIATAGTAICYAIGRKWWPWIRPIASTLLTAFAAAYAWMQLISTKRAGAGYALQEEAFAPAFAISCAVYLPFALIFWLLVDRDQASGSQDMSA